MAESNGSRLKQIKARKLPVGTAQIAEALGCRRVDVTRAFQFPPESFRDVPGKCLRVGRRWIIQPKMIARVVDMVECKGYLPADK